MRNISWNIVSREKKMIVDKYYCIMETKTSILSVTVNCYLEYYLHVFFFFNNSKQYLITSNFDNDSSYRKKNACTWTNKQRNSISISVIKYLDQISWKNNREVELYTFLTFGYYRRYELSK